MPIYKVTVKVTRVYSEYVFAASEEEALQIPKGPEWDPGMYPDDAVEEDTQTFDAEKVTDPAMVSEGWLHAIPWGDDVDEDGEHKERTVLELLNNDA